MRGKGSTILLITIFALIVLFCGYMTVMYFFHPADTTPLVKAKLKDPNFPLGTWRLFFYLHILFGTIALISGAFQLSNPNRRKSLHKILGRIYAGSILINGLMVPYLARFATGGIGSGMAFLLLDAVWLFTTGMGVWWIFQGKIKKHREWILRSYAVTWVFVTFRFLLPLCQFLVGLPTSWAFPVSVFFALAINLLITEIYLRRREGKWEIVA